MSKIDQLIQDLCPDGVKFLHLAEVATVTIGEFVHKNKQNPNGLYPVYNGGRIETGFYDHYNNSGNKIVISARGAYAGFVNRLLKPYWAGNSSYSVTVKDTTQADWNYVYYYLKKSESKFTDSQQKGGIPAVSKKQVESFKIPIPPLEVQKEIVNILDKFTQLEAELSAELSAELDARRKQYEYYRDYLFSDSGPKMQKKPLATLAKKIYSGGTPKTGNAEYWDNGTIPWMSSGEVNLGTVYATEKFITETGLKNSSAKWVPKNSVVIALAGQGKTRGTVARTRIELTTNQSLASLVFDEKVINPDYVFHFLRSQYQELRRISSGDGTRGGLNLKMIGNFDIPVRPLSEQDRIVSILDRFELLINDMSVGLPAEINARRQQYEYYRTKLLTFQELSA